jgi:soluble lytic murein transglycosylase-like protein
MRFRRRARVVLLGLVWAWSVAAPAPAAADGALRLPDEDGLVHLTNIPEDPRYRRRPRSIADIREISRRHGLSAALVEAVVRAESRFDPSSQSPKGAVGLMQLMPGTAAALGVADRLDARENLNGGVRHLRYLLDRYRGDVSRALAAYNAGEAAVDMSRGIPPFPETRAYVRRVLELAGLADSGGRGHILYRYAGPDDTTTYSNIPARPDRHDHRP